MALKSQCPAARWHAQADQSFDAPSTTTLLRMAFAGTCTVIALGQLDLWSSTCARLLLHVAPRSSLQWLLPTFLLLSIRRKFVLRLSLLNDFVGAGQQWAGSRCLERADSDPLLKLIDEVIEESRIR